MVEYIYEDESIIVCYKPAGIPVETRAVGQTDMESILRNHRLTQNEVAEIYTVHRLDQPVEGVMVFAKDKKAAAALGKQISSEGFSKKYKCVVGADNLLDGEELMDYIMKDGKSNLSVVVAPTDKRGKKSKLSYKVLKKSKKGRYLLDVELFTGRHHQIRCQLANRGAAIVGDVKYGGEPTRRPLALCAYKLNFCHPVTGKRMEFTCVPRGEDFIDLMSEE